MVIDWNGNIKSNLLLGNVNIINMYWKNIYQDDNNIEDRNEHVLFESILDSSNILMKRFIITSDKGELVKTQDIRIQMPKNYNDFNVYRTIDSNFLFTFVYTSTTNNITQNTLSLEPELCVYGSILQKDTNQLSDLFLIYQTSISNIKLVFMSCIQFYDGSGFYCIMQFTNSVDNTLVKVVFLSNGKIIETKKETNFGDNNFDIFSLVILKSGALALATLKYDVYGCNITGYFLRSNNQRVNSNSNPKIHVDYPCGIDILNNNGTVILIPEIKEKYWTLSTLDIPNVMNDKGYQNPIINWTIPAINEIISLETTQIQIDYNVPIKCSSKNIYIYQKLDNKKVILRETYSAQSNNCQVLPNNTTLLLTILPSTFNQPNSSYYIKIDTDFVKQNSTLEPLFGILENIWMFTTESREYMIDDSVSGFLRLTDQGTLYFLNLSSEEKSNFVQNLTSQLADIIPVPSYRIKSNNRYQVDTKRTLHQILINIQIFNSNSVSELNVSSIVNYLNILVKNNEITPISTYNLTSMLDNTYGFQTYRSFVDLITLPVIVMASILFILIICYLWANRRYKEGKNLIIIITAFMLYDFIMDLLFIFDSKSKNLPLLFWLLNLICTILPIIFNLSVAIYIIYQENIKNQKFYNYFIENTAIVNTFSVIAGADIEVLHILSSRFANLNVFSAKFSKKAEDYIFWCGLIGLLFEDIPQLGIRIAYNVPRIEYTTIQALSLISSILTLLINIIGRLHSIIIRCRNPPSEQ